MIQASPEMTARMLDALEAVKSHEPDPDAALFADLPAFAELPLEDGTCARLEGYAKTILRQTYGVTRGRIRHSAKGDYVVVTPRKNSETNGEVRLTDLLATMCYELPGEHWELVDGDPRNLRRENIAPVSAARCTEIPKAVSGQTSQNDSPEIQRQLDMLALAVAGQTPGKQEPLVAIAVAILKNRALAEEIAGKTVLEIVEKIRCGVFRGSDAQFYSWIRKTLRWDCYERLQGALQGAIGDILPDPGKQALTRRLRERLPSEKPFFAAYENGQPTIFVSQASSKRPTADEQTGYFEE